MTGKRNGEIDVLRLLFAMAVLLHHFNSTFEFGSFKNGYIGVEYFYIVTGFLTSRSLAAGTETDVPLEKVGEKTWQLILKKVKSFYRYYLAVILLQIVVLDTLIRHTSVFKTAYNILAGIPTITLTFMGIDMKTRSLYVSGMWYLSAMVIALFLLYPLMLRYYSFSVSWIFPVLTLFLFGYMFHGHGTLSCWDTWEGAVYGGVLRAVAEIAFGASLYVFTKRLTEVHAKVLQSESLPVKILLTLLKAGCIAFVFVFAYGSVMGHRLRRAVDIPVFFILAAGVVLCFANAGFCIPDSACTRFCGKVSLGLYIFHGLIQLCIIHTGNGASGSFSRVLPLIIFTVILSILLMYVTDYAAAFLNRLRAGFPDRTKE